MTAYALQTRTEAEPPREDGRLRKLASSIRPTGRERRFRDDEIIVTKTDPRGVIIYANPVFLRMSALEEREALGAPHSTIRHPDMPRCVFALLWERIRSGREIFAYVLNLAADGDHYWVLAHVTPSFDRSGAPVGYHSNRRNPERGAVGEVAGVYARLKAVEDGCPDKAAGVAASRAAMDQMLGEKGVGYDEFVFGL